MTDRDARSRVEEIRNFSERGIYDSGLHGQVIRNLLAALAEAERVVGEWRQAREVQQQALNELGLLGSPVEELRRLLAALAEREREVEEYAEALAACLLAQPTSKGEYVHLLVCSGDRREPAGKPGHSCSCAIVPKSQWVAAEAARDEARAEVARLREALEAYLDDHNAEWETSLTERGAMCPCRKCSAARAALTPERRA